VRSVLLALLKLSVAEHRHTEQLGGASDGQAEPFSIVTHHLPEGGGQAERLVGQSDLKDVQFQPWLSSDDRCGARLVGRHDADRLSRGISGVLGLFLGRAFGITSPPGRPARSTKEAATRPTRHQEERVPLPRPRRHRRGFFRHPPHRSIGLPVGTCHQGGCDGQTTAESDWRFVSSQADPSGGYAKRDGDRESDSGWFHRPGRTRHGA
jgi:hypothetical protein